MEALFQQTWACFFYQKWWPLSKPWVGWSFSKWLAKWMAPILQVTLTLDAWGCSKRVSIVCLIGIVEKI